MLTMLNAFIQRTLGRKPELKYTPRRDIRQLPENHEADCENVGSNHLVLHLVQMSNLLPKCCLSSLLQLQKTVSNY